MTVGELIRKLQQCPLDVPVVIQSIWCDGEYMEIASVTHQPKVEYEDKLLVNEYVAIHD